MFSPNLKRKLKINIELLNQIQNKMLYNSEVNNENEEST